MNEEAYVRAFRLAIVAAALIHARQKDPGGVPWLEGEVVTAQKRLADFEETL